MTWPIPLFSSLTVQLLEWGGRKEQRPDFRRKRTTFSLLPSPPPPAYFRAPLPPFPTLHPDVPPSADLVLPPRRNRSHVRLESPPRRTPPQRSPPRPGGHGPPSAGKDRRLEGLEQCQRLDRTRGRGLGTKGGRGRRGRGGLRSRRAEEGRW